jgi:solute carrier family 25 phosphate transporter 3
VGGILGGTSAALVSNPADAVISEMKKAKSDMTPQEAVNKMLENAGVASLFKGLRLRMVFYSLVASLQFLVYDGVRLALGVGPDDFKLYLDVLGGALQQSGGPV